MATTGSSPPLQSQPSPQYTSTPITIILILILLVFFFVGFFSIYFCRCLFQNLIYVWTLRHNPSGSPVGVPALCGPGLDHLIVQSYPTFSYSNVKPYRREKYVLECAICLVEFKDIDVLRLLTPCCHIFHQECIDLWLESHKTCPVCRRDLNSTMESPIKCGMYVDNVMHNLNDNDSVEDSLSITIKEENQNDQDEKRASGKNVEQVDDLEKGKVDKFSKSHSTGHSIVRNGEEEDRFILILPEHVKSKIIKGHNSSRSWTTYGDYKTKTKDGNVGLAEVSEFSSEDINEV